VSSSTFRAPLACSSAAGNTIATMKFVIANLLWVLSMVQPAGSQTAKPSAPADLAAYAGGDRERLIHDGARREGKLVWYTTLAAEQNKQIANAFEKKYPGISVETFRTGSSALAQRLLTEAKARRHIADAVETTPPGLITFREHQLLLPYRSPHLGNFPEEARNGRATIWSTGPMYASPMSALPITRAF
jgi:iron(III) transport system substrate-binding protein